MVSRGRKRKKDGKLNKRVGAPHYPHKFKGNTNPDCVVCSIRKEKCKIGGKDTDCKRKQSKFFCPKCPGKPGLCIQNDRLDINCFEIYHKKIKYKQECKCSE